MSVVSKTIASLTTETGQCDHSVGLLEVNDTEIVPDCYNNNNYFYYLADFLFSFYVTLDVINLSGVESTLVGRVFESASYIRGIEYREYFLIFMTKPRIYFSPNGGDCAIKDGLNECILLRPSLWIERVKPVCFSLPCTCISFSPMTHLPSKPLNLVHCIRYRHVNLWSF